MSAHIRLRQFTILKSFVCRRFLPRKPQFVLSFRQTTAYNTKQPRRNKSPWLLLFCVRSLLRVFLFADLSDRLHDIVAELAAGAAVLAACDFELLSSYIQMSSALSRRSALLLLADMGEQHDTRSEHRAGVCVLRSALANHSRSRAVNGLKHRVALADVCAAGSADAALEFRRLVGDYIAVEIRENEYLEVAAALRR